MNSVEYGVCNQPQQSVSTQPLNRPEQSLPTSKKDVSQKQAKTRVVFQPFLDAEIGEGREKTASEVVAFCELVFHVSEYIKDICFDQNVPATRSTCQRVLALKCGVVRVDVTTLGDWPGPDKWFSG